MSCPGLGTRIVQWLWGGFAVSGTTLTRFFSLHYVLPFAIVGVVILHIWALHTVGVAGPVIDVGSGRQLAADLDAGNHQGVQIRARGIERRGVAGGARTEDHEPMMRDTRHVHFAFAARAPATMRAVATV